MNSTLILLILFKPYWNLVVIVNRREVYNSWDRLSFRLLLKNTLTNDVNLSKISHIISRFGMGLDEVYNNYCNYWNRRILSQVLNFIIDHREHAFNLLSPECWTNQIVSSERERKLVEDQQLITDLPNTLHLEGDADRLIKYSWMIGAIDPNGDWRLNFRWHSVNWTVWYQILLLEDFPLEHLLFSAITAMESLWTYLTEQLFRRVHKNRKNQMVLSKVYSILLSRLQKLPPASNNARRYSSIIITIEGYLEGMPKFSSILQDLLTQKDIPYSHVKDYLLTCPKDEFVWVISQQSHDDSFCQKYVINEILGRVLSTQVPHWYHDYYQCMNRVERIQYFRYWNRKLPPLTYHETYDILSKKWGTDALYTTAPSLNLGRTLQLCTQLIKSLVSEGTVRVESQNNSGKILNIVHFLSTPGGMTCLENMNRRRAAMTLILIMKIHFNVHLYELNLDWVKMAACENDNNTITLGLALDTSYRQALKIAYHPIKC